MKLWKYYPCQHCIIKIVCVETCDMVINLKERWRIEEDLKKQICPDCGESCIINKHKYRVLVDITCTKCKHVFQSIPISRIFVKRKLKS